MTTHKHHNCGPQFYTARGILSQAAEYVILPWKFGNELGCEI